jgi:adenylate cyclase
MIERWAASHCRSVRSKVREDRRAGARHRHARIGGEGPFASFVPVGLVRELLTTDAKTQLGGHSRFLTILFSDLENFSSLSERIPTQVLLQRVSRISSW